MTPLRIVGALLIAALAATGGAHAQQFTEGTHYKRMTPPVKTEAPKGKIEVREFFWYGCPHCYSLEPHVRRWLTRAPKEVHFIQTPAILGQQWSPHAYTYYTLDELGVLDKFHDVFFKALHQEKRRLISRDSIADYFAGHGVERKRFINVYDSLSVNSRIQKAENLAMRYEVRGVPLLTVNGRYALILRSMNSYEQMMQLIDHLVEIELRAMRAAQQ